MNHVERTELYAKDIEEIYKELNEGKIPQEIKNLRVENATIKWRFDLYIIAVMAICPNAKCKLVEKRFQQFSDDGYNCLQNKHKQKRLKQINSFTLEEKTEYLLDKLRAQPIGSENV